VTRLNKSFPLAAGVPAGASPGERVDDGAVELRVVVRRGIEKEPFGIGDSPVAVRVAAAAEVDLAGARLTSYARIDAAVAALPRSARQRGDGDVQTVVAAVLVQAADDVVPVIKGCINDIARGVGLGRRRSR
jgi:hypothetical protein